MKIFRMDAQEKRQSEFLELPLLLFVYRFQR